MPFVPDTQQPSIGHFVPDAPVVPGANDYQDNYQGPLNEQQFNAQPAQDAVRDSNTGQTFTAVPRTPGYDPNKLTFAGNQIPDALKPYASKITDLAAGGYETLANTLGAPTAAVANVFNGLAGRQFATSDDMKKAILDGLNKIPGMAAGTDKAFSQWWGDLGDKAAQQLVLAGTLIAGAPAIVSAGEKLGAGSLGGSVLKNVGEQAVLNPGQVAASAAGAGALGHVASSQPVMDFLHSGGVDVSPQVMELIGNLAGGVLGSQVGSMARIIPAAEGTAKNVFGSISRRGLPRFGGNQVNQAMPGARGLLPQSFSSDDIGKAVQGYKDQVTNYLEDRMSRIMGTGEQDPAVAAARLRKVNEDAYTKAGQIEDMMWGETNLKRNFPTQSAKNIAIQIAQSAKDPFVKLDTIPGDAIQAIKKLPSSVSIERARQVIGVIRKQAATIGMQGNNLPTNDVYRANLTKLANGLEDAIVAQYPGDIALAKARQFSTWKHDTFSRGPSAGFSEVRNMDMAKAPAQDALKQAMRDERFGTNQADMEKSLNLTPEVKQANEEALRSQVREYYQNELDTNAFSAADPLTAQAQAAAKANKYMNTPDFKRMTKAFPALNAIMQRQVNQLQTALGQAVAIKRSAFLSHAGENPEAAVERLWGSGNSLQEARTIKGALDKLGQKGGAAAQDAQNAQEALSYALVRKLGNSVNWDPSRMMDKLSTRDTSRLVNELIGEKEYARLQRILKAGVSYQGRFSNDSVIGMSPTVTAGRVIGSLLTRASGGHTIQVTSIGTKIGGNMMSRLFHIIPPETIIGKAMVDPNWERFLMAKVPENMDNIRATNDMLGAMVGGLSEGNQLIRNKQETSK